MKYAFHFLVSVTLLVLAGAAMAAPGQRLVASDGAPHDRFGMDVAAGNNVIAVSAGAADIDGQPNRGAVYIFTRKGKTWSETAKLTASDGSSSDVFGSSLVLAGNTLFVAAYNATVDGYPGAGVVYMFSRRGNDWVPAGKLLPPVPEAYGRFGSKLAVDGKTLLVGSRLATGVAGRQTGVVHVYDRHGNDWVRTADLYPDGYLGFASFGQEIDIDDDTIVIGQVQYGIDDGNGMLHIYKRNAIGWEHVAVRRPGNEVWPVESATGSSVGISGDTALVTAHRDTWSGWPRYPGVVYGYRRIDGGWTEQPFVLESSTPHYSGWFGYTLEMEDGLLAIREGWNNSVHLYAEQDGGGWVETHHLTSPTASSDYGEELAFSRDVVVIADAGARVDDDTWQGVVYVYDRDDL